MEFTQQKPVDRDPFLWKQAKARVGFRIHLRTYLIINAGLWLIWAISSFSFQSTGNWVSPWPIFPMLGWGIGLVSHYFAVFHWHNERAMIEHEYQKLRSQQL